MNKEQKQQETTAQCAIQNVSNLLPCPFCGGKVEEDVVQWNIAQAKCTECGETWGTCGSKYEGRFEKWNFRAR